MKLLASVLSVAAADYACCPYDDFGVPDPTCVNVLTEKSPFSAASGNALVPQESYACKAWEANAGAASEPHKGGTADDWGSCGFQRHFPWYHTAHKNGTDHATILGLWDNLGAAKYQVLATGGTFQNPLVGNGNFNFLSLASGSFSGATPTERPVVGDVHLGAVCKLFVPVLKTSIRQVSVAGVHVNNARIAGAASRALSAEFNAAVIGNIDGAALGGTHSADYHAGTAYCFSVVNIAEFMTNRANKIANANVAGEDETARGSAGTGSEWFADDVGLKYSSTGVPSDAQFGVTWPGAREGTKFGALVGTPGQKNSGQHKVNMGSNFDVVVHFETSWCKNHWNIVDMQKTNDHGNGSGTTGHLEAFDNTSHEGRMDAWDKRLPAGVGSCGLCYDKTSAPLAPGKGGVSLCVANQVTGFDPTKAGTQETLDKTFNMDYNSNTSGLCKNINGYSSNDGTAPNSTKTRWPNAGAWAAFYSFITCANSDYMIYGPATRGRREVTVNISNGTPGTNHLVETPEGSEGPEVFQDGTFDKQNNGASPAIGNNDNRMVVVGGWHQDYRHGTGACVRFNLRQVGNHVEYCADGDEERFNRNPSTDGKNPTGDTSAWSQNGPTRCTWNWNYNVLTDAGKSFDAEAWFDSVDPLHQQVWQAPEVFVDEPTGAGNPGVVSSQASGYAAAALGTLVDPIRIQLLIQDARNSPTSLYVGPNSIEMDASSYVSAATPTSFVATLNATTTPTETEVNDAVTRFDTTSAGTYTTVTVSCIYTPPNPAAVVRSNFPDCFFGDEIHGQWVWSDANMLQNLDRASGTSIWKFWAMIKNHQTSP